MANTQKEMTSEVTVGESKPVSRPVSKLTGLGLVLTIFNTSVLLCTLVLVGIILQRVGPLPSLEPHGASARLQRGEKPGSASSSSTANGTDASVSWTPKEPLLPGVMPGVTRPKLILAQDVDWPPYAYLAQTAGKPDKLAGFGHDIAMLMPEVCGIDVHMVEDRWANCYTQQMIGTALEDGHYHACSTYTHTEGARPRTLEFSDAILNDNKPSGILTRLVNGKPLVSPQSNLAGVRIADVTGWAPTMDTLKLESNACTGEAFSGYQVVLPPKDGNDAAMAMLMSGEADAIWIYADQAYNYRDCPAGATWDCSKWQGKLGVDFAYIHTGMFNHAVNGTTLTMSKKGSGLPQIVNPCLQKVMQTKGYYDACKAAGFEATCFANSHFPAGTAATRKIFHYADTERASFQYGCADGYCKCDAVAAPAEPGSGGI